MARRLLLVEDHEDLRRTLGCFLSQSFIVLSAANGLEALNCLSKGEIPDVIITDSSMPEMDGETLLYQLRCSGLWSGIPVLVLGSANDEAEGLRFKQLGAHAYFPKPFSPGRLQQKITDLLD